MLRRETVADRMAEVVARRLVTRKLIDAKDEPSAHAAVRAALVENLRAEAELESEATRLLAAHAERLRESAVDYRAMLARVKEKLARDRGFVL